MKGLQNFRKKKYTSKIKILRIVNNYFLIHFYIVLKHHVTFFYSKIYIPNYYYRNNYSIIIIFLRNRATCFLQYLTFNF